MKSTLNPGEQLVPGDWLYSQNGHYTFGMQGNGIPYLYMLHPKNGELWHANAPRSGKILRMQHDGNLVLHDSQSIVIWSSDTPGNPE